MDTMTRLDYYDILPAGLDAYLSHYGWHFNKALCEWAVSQMRDKNEEKIPMKSKEKVESLLHTYGVEIENDRGYDKVFVYHMGVSDYLGDSVPDDAHLARYVKNVLDDKDGYDGIALTRFLADCNGKGIPVIWEDMI